MNIGKTILLLFAYTNTLLLSFLGAFSCSNLNFAFVIWSTSLIALLMLSLEGCINKVDPTEEEILNIIEGELMKELSNEVITCERFEYPVFKKVAKAIYKRITEGAE